MIVFKFLSKLFCWHPFTQVKMEGDIFSQEEYYFKFTCKNCGKILASTGKNLPYGVSSVNAKISIK